MKAPRPSAGSRFVWIDWGHHLRTNTLAARLNLPVEEILVPGGRLRRYLVSAVRTWVTLRRLRPNVVLATNPSIVLALLLLILRRRLGFAVVSDAHFLGVQTLTGAGAQQKLLDYCNKKNDLVIVTNESHAKHVASVGGRAFICPDPLPDLASFTQVVTVPRRSAFLICSFGEDEPYRQVFIAFQKLSAEGFVLHVSGNYRRAGVNPAEYPWVQFLGYIPQAVYYGYLRGCQVIVDLTTVDNCLLCGAYEALALRKPLVISRTSALESYFGEAAVFTANDAESIAAAIRQCDSQAQELTSKADDWVRKNELYMTGTVTQLAVALDELACQVVTGRPASPFI